MQNPPKKESSARPSSASAVRASKTAPKEQPRSSTSANDANGKKAVVIPTSASEVDATPQAAAMTAGRPASASALPQLSSEIDLENVDWDTYPLPGSDWDRKVDAKSKRVS